MLKNPWAHSRVEPEIAEPDYPPALRASYAVPTLEDAPYTDTFGWAPVLRQEPGSTPDPNRLHTLPLRDYRPDPDRPPEFFWRRLDEDHAGRHSVEYVDADGWTETKTGFGQPNPARGAHRFADNPRANPPPEARLTQAMSPHSYVFTRPFMTGLPKEGSRSLNGIHFSMANHRRTYDILGMAPPRRGRNTYRIEPEPWDADIVDLPPQQDPSPSARIQGMEVNYGSRSWRLG